MTDEQAISTLILKRCHGNVGHEQDAMLPVDDFYNSKTGKNGKDILCKKCRNAATSACGKRKTQRLQLERSFIPEQLADIKPDTSSKKDKELVSSTFILTEAKALYFAKPEPRLEQKIKLLELMAKYSPEMKNAKPQDKVALMAAMMESLAKEQQTDAISVQTNKD